MQAGQLKEVISIYKHQTTVTEFGEQITDYVFKYKTRARINYNRGSRDNVNNEIFHATEREFIVRIYVKVKEEDRILYNGQYYTILSIQPDPDFQQKTIIGELVNE